VRVAIFGRGKVGSALLSQLRRAKVEVGAHDSRSNRPASRAADVFILAVPDAQIAPLAERLAPHLSRKSVVLHCAGARGPEELAACARAGAAVAGFHPLVSFASRRQVPSLTGCVFVAHGDLRATRAARRIARALGAQCVARPMLGPAYHAMAAMVANGSAAIAFSALGTLRQLGMSQAEAERALAGLLQSVSANTRNVGLPEALTGPVVRRDSATVKAHLTALRVLAPETASDYAALQPMIRKCAAAHWQLTPEIAE
jgi:predicted short-subunit dehydrogenase-like oxidoreductase (DUF2520 family)